MPINNSFNPRSVGQFPPTVANNPLNIIAKRAPTTADRAPIGQVWVNTATNTVYQLTSIVGGSSIWTSSNGSSGGTFSAVTITGGAGTVLEVQAGDVAIDTGNLAVTAGNVTVGGDLTVAGTASFTGTLSLTSAGAIHLTSTDNVVQAIYLNANGGAAETVELHSTQGTSDLSVNLVSDVGGITLLASSSTSVTSINVVSVDGGITVASGLQLALDSSDASATAIVINASNAAGGIAIDANSGGIALAAVNGPIPITSGTGAISIGNDATGKTITIGTTNSSTGIVMQVGTGNFSLNGVAGSTYAIGASTTTGTITIGGTAQTGNLTLGSSSAAQNVVIANGTGASTVHIADNQTAGSVAIGSGMSTGTVSIGGTGANTGTINLAPGTGAQTVGIASSGTGAKTVNIGTGAISANVITIGGTAANSSVTIQAGSGATGIDLSAAGNVQMVPQSGSSASPTASITINNRVGVATFTGFTTANAGGTQNYTINNSTILTTSGIFLTVTSLNPSTNGAQIEIIGTTQAAGSLIVHTANNGAGALGAGDNVLITFWVIS